MEKSKQTAQGSARGRNQAANNKETKKIVGKTSIQQLGNQENSRETEQPHGETKQPSWEDKTIIWEDQTTTWGNQTTAENSNSQLGKQVDNRENKKTTGGKRKATGEKELET
ncbi:hypothetical protein MA16_Dca000057 [Dendrobium catenatum]|uniref:Uncharacterized protein n=1 Tax=Dendrobium catenatum TaxID=906689 RepID=A0A2I0WST0_9ASPA|nr:hypothetical protein MA16_Dca000057 [Dendrobium catenatum]